MAMPNVYQTITDSPTATYTFTEIANGAGVAGFDALATTTSGAVVARGNMSTGVGLWAKPQTSSTTGGALVSYTFSNPANSYSRVIEGTAFIQASYAVRKDAGSGTGWVIWTIEKLNPDTTVTTIGTANGTVITASSGSTVTTELVGIPLTKTYLNVGDILRLKATLAGSDGSTNTHLAHDPANRDIGSNPAFTATTNPTYLRWYVPFKIDL